jgi:hypothetical protein
VHFSGLFFGQVADFFNRRLPHNAFLIGWAGRRIRNNSFCYFYYETNMPEKYLISARHSFQGIIAGMLA